jgi:hypothetical protein
MTAAPRNQRPVMGFGASRAIVTARLTTPPRKGGAQSGSAAQHYAGEGHEWNAAGARSAFPGTLFPGTLSAADAQLTGR